MAEMKVFSTGIDPEDWIPPRFTALGEGKTPSIFWQHLPEKTRSLVLVMEWREAAMGQRVHWLVYDLPPMAEGIHEGGPLPAGAKLGRNDFGESAYHAPEPDPQHHLRHYDFVLFATDLPTLDLAPGADFAAVKARLHKAVHGDDIVPPPAADARARELYPLGHIIGNAEFSGHFARDTDRHI